MTTAAFCRICTRSSSVPFRISRPERPIGRQLCSSSSTTSAAAEEGLNEGVRRGEMRCWQIHSYNNNNLHKHRDSSSPGSHLQYTTTRIPIISSPKDVLVRVQAASINPIDVAMSRGYGAETINLMRQVCNAKGPFGLPKLPSPRSRSSFIEFPLTLGRDFAGTIEDMGHGAKGEHDLFVGDEVYGVVPVHRQGSHAEYVITSVDQIRKIPKGLNFVEAASIPYVGLTSWSAIKVTGNFRSLGGKRFLVLGGSGGVGTFAVQYLHSQGCFVTTTCSSDAVSLMVSLGSDFVVDYKTPDALSAIELHAPYDCILDLSGPSNYKNVEDYVKFLRSIGGQYITLNPPFLSNIDKYGVVGGGLVNASDLFATNCKTWSKGSVVTKWAFFIPNGSPLESFTRLLETGKIQPVIHQSFKLDQAEAAYQAVEGGHLRGKVVLDLT